MTLSLKQVVTLAFLMGTTALMSTCWLVPGWTPDHPVNQPKPKDDDRR